MLTLLGLSYYDILTPYAITLTIIVTGQSVYLGHSIADCFTS